MFAALAVFVRRVVLPSDLEQLSSPGRIVHHCLICCLLLLLDCQHWVILDLCRCVSGSIGILQGHEPFLRRILLHGFARVSFHQTV